MVSICVPFAWIGLLLLAGDVWAAELKDRTKTAFDRYVQLAEARMDGDVRGAQTFLRVDSQADGRRQDMLSRLRRGEVVTERVSIGQRIDAPDGLIHHWAGTVFVPGVRVGDAVALLQDYDRHATIFAPNVVQSRILERQGNRFRVFLRFYLKKVIGVTMDTENDARFVTVAPDRVYSSIHSTRVAEVADAGTSSEHEEVAGRGHGFMWRLNTYWRFLERDGGTYVQCESISLSRDVPFGLGWLIKPFVTEIPEESLAFTLERTKRALTTHH